MDLAPLLAAGRAAHEELMVDTVQVLAPGSPVYDSATGATVRPDSRVLYSGRARVKPAAAVSETAQTGQRLVVQRRYEVALPWSVAALGTVVPGVQVVVDASPDPRLAGLTLWVTSVAESATATAWRLAAEDRS
ncbi:DUF6093 family protein [Kitasatospora sp. CB02891]|uniref:DUF6093 family protein n=1 Tax=Kitasatospora sp. CB02891 TaxID=2020329 RepID=UPI000C275B81|nr:DUF6093 family protein [Kitasatospora sp. CB02891]PJN24060.1 hypothetical protein CG736_19380 [Kitasatospora sp. CB02891]